jgi:DNA-binding XRE family transcriptional regulator
MGADNWWKKARVKLGLRKTELAKKAGLSTRTILRLESGDESITEETKNKVKIGLKAK